MKKTLFFILALAISQGLAYASVVSINDTRYASSSSGSSDYDSGQSGDSKRGGYYEKGITPESDEGESSPKKGGGESSPKSGSGSGNQWVRIVALKDLAFSSYDQAGNFDPTSPFVGTTGVTQWTTNDYTSTNISAIPDSSWGTSSSTCVDALSGTSCHAVSCTPDDGTSLYANHANAFRGVEYTDAIVNQIGNSGLAAYAAKSFYPTGVSSSDATFGAGKWYLPAIGELMLLYGTDWDNSNTYGQGSAGSFGNVKATVNTALSTLAASGVTAATLTDSWYWSSSEYGNDYSWRLYMGIGYRTNYAKNDYHNYVRAFQLLENCFTSTPTVGDVVYSDMSYGAATDYDGTKTPIGIVYWVGEEDSSSGGDDSCPFANCNLVSDCVYADSGSLTISSDSCTCSINSNSIELCDTQFAYDSSVEYNNYARAHGVRSGDYNEGYHYYSNSAALCPVLLNSPTQELAALKQNYYINTVALDCATTTTNVNLSTIQCIRPGYGTPSSETSVKVCVYQPNGMTQTQYNDSLSYSLTNASGLQLCASKDNQMYSSQARTLYAMNSYSDIPSLASTYYYQYKPSANIDPGNSSYHLVECYIDCSADISARSGGSYDIAPKCQGWYYLPSCQTFVADEGAQFYTSALSSSYITDTHAFSGYTEICYDTSTNAKASFIRCGLKHSYDPTNGVFSESDCVAAGTTCNGGTGVYTCGGETYCSVCAGCNGVSESQCNVSNGTCAGVTGAYSCAGDTYCPACVCRSDLQTLSEWCAASSITENCTTEYYEGSGDVCILEDANDPKYATWGAVVCTGITESQCNAGYGTCAGAPGEYACAGQTYCTSCLCQSGLYTLSEWCVANNITENCDTTHYEGTGNVCTLEDANNPKYASWSAVTCNGVSETQCNTGYGTCTGAPGEYACGGTTYCTSCICQSGLLTLSEWCIAGNITENCTTDYYEGSGNVCILEDASNPKYASWSAVTCSGVSETQCNTGYGTCTGAPGEYACGGTTYCTSCLCQSGLYTLSDWCAVHNITENCTLDYYEGTGNGCNYEDTSNPKYSNWQLRADVLCPSENDTLALEDYASHPLAWLKGRYGQGIAYGQCYSSDGVLKWKITCDASEYNTICNPSSSSTIQWCVHGGDASTLMRDAAISGNSKYCRSTTAVGICGQVAYSADDNSSIYPSATLKMYITSSPEQCYSQYGRGSTWQQCATTEGDLKYNCYYNLAEYQYSTTTANGAKPCAVRHDLSGNYIIYKGQKRWAECNCPSVYKYHTYNCGTGILAGSACKQDMTNVASSPYLQSIWTNSDNNIPLNTLLNMTELNLYPSCACDPAYAYTCEGERMSGDDSDMCGGKYRSCNCEADPIPDNWADNYFGCPEGYHATGVWKDNGCGQKVYQCSNSIECTAEYTETCSGPGEIGVGEGCQDSSGNYVRWKACECRSEYVTKCDLENQIGVGDACVIGTNDPLYTACTCPSGWGECVSPAVPTSGSSNCRIEDPDNNIYSTVYSQCECPSGWSTCGEDGQIGDESNPDQVCISGGTKVYANCICPTDYLNCATYSQPGIGRPFFNDTYVGVSGASYGQCRLPNVAWEEYRYEACKCNDEKFPYVCDGIGALPVGVSCKTAYDQKEIWSSCICNNQYTDACASEEGKSVKPSMAHDYCQVGGEGSKLYKPSSCECSVSGWTACNGTGQVGVGDSCLVGIASASNLPKYKICECASPYTLKCNGAGQSGISAACVNSSGETYYSDCDCNPNWIACASTQSGIGDVCTDEGVNYYASCQCKEEYKYDCLGSAYSAPTDITDVCVSGTTSYYRSCNCAPGYTKTCDGTGQQPSDPNDFCEHEGVRYYTSCMCGKDGYDKTCPSSSKLRPENANDFCMEEDGIKKYKACKCATGYGATCSDRGYLPPANGSIDFCDLNGVSYYTTCACASGMQRCNGTGQVGAGSVCVSGGSLDDEGEWIGGTTYYQNCSCPNSYAECGTVLGGATASTSSGNTCVVFTSSLHKVNNTWVVSDISSTNKNNICACPTSYHVSSETQQSLISNGYSSVGVLCTTGMEIDTRSSLCIGWYAGSAYNFYDDCVYPIQPYNPDDPDISPVI